MGEVESRDDNDRPIIEEKRISHHFDFKIDGGIGGQDNGNMMLILVMLIS